MINLRIKHGSTGCRWKFQEDNKCSVTEDPTLTKSGRSCRFLWPKVTLGQRNICLLLPELCLVKSHLAPVNKNMNFGLSNKNTKKQHWLWPSARHFKEVTVTLSKVTVTLKWRADGQGHLEWRHFKWPSHLKILEKFFLLNFAILGNFTSFRVKKIFWKFSKVTVTLKWRADGHVIRSDRHF